MSGRLHVSIIEDIRTEQRAYSEVDLARLELLHVHLHLCDISMAVLRLRWGS